MEFNKIYDQDDHGQSDRSHHSHRKEVPTAKQNIKRINNGGQERKHLLHPQHFNKKPKNSDNTKNRENDSTNTAPFFVDP